MAMCFKKDHDDFICLTGPRNPFPVPEFNYLAAFVVMADLGLLVTQTIHKIGSGLGRLTNNDKLT